MITSLHINDQYSIDELGLSLQQLNDTTAKAKIWLVGDFMYLVATLTGNICQREP